jgi:hypothetical protein
MKNKAEKGAGFASRSFSEGLGNEYMKTRQRRARGIAGK